MKFSIVVPVYNTDKYLDKCIESLLLQSFKEFEVILVDDGSTDQSGKICDSYVKLYPDIIKCIHKSNEGLLLTRLRGYEEARGEYILNVDSDDEIRSDALFLIDKVIKKYSADLIIFQAAIDNNYSDIWKNSRLDLPTGHVFSPLLLKSLICSGPTINNMALKCVKKNLLNDIQSLKRFINTNNEEDLMQSVLIINNCKSPFYIPETLYYYRQDNVSSISNNFNPNIFISIKNSSKLVQQYAMEWSKEKTDLINTVYVRHIKSCCALVRYYFERAKSKKQITEFLRTLQKDEFFIMAYLHSNKKELSMFERSIIFFIYHKLFYNVFLLMNFRAIIRNKQYAYICLQK